MPKRVKPKRKLIVNHIEGSFDLVTGNNFSYKSIPENKKLEVPENMQMTVHEEFQIEQNAELILEGEIILEP